MGQLEDLRESLKKRKDSPERGEIESPVKSGTKTNQGRLIRKTLGIYGGLHLELKALNIWRIKNHNKPSSWITDIIREMLKVYYKKYPEAKKFVDDFCE